MAINRRTFLRVSGGLLTSFAYHLSKPWHSFSAQRPAIRIGVINTLSGALASFGQGAFQAEKMAVDELNQKGGVLGRSLELFVSDDQGKLSRVVMNIKRMAKENAVAILGSPVMFENKDVTEAAESAGISLFLLNPFKVGIKADRLDYTFRLQPQANLVVIRMVAYLLELSQRRGIGIQDIGVFWDQGDIWRDSLDSILTLVRRNKKRITFNHQLPPSWPPAEMKKGIDVIVDEIRSQSADIMVVLGYPGQLTSLVQSVRQSGIKTKAIVGFSNLAVSNPWFVKDQGRNLLNVMDANYWGNPGNPAARSFSERFSQTYGRVPSNDAYQGYSIIQVLKDALYTSKTADRRAISACLHEREFQHHLLAQRKPIRFNQTGQNANAEMVLLQVSNPVPKIIYPDVFSEKEAVFEL